MLTLGVKTPYEVLFGNAPNYNHRQIFRCLCYGCNLNCEKVKFASRKFYFKSTLCICWTSFGKNGWRFVIFYNEFHVLQLNSLGMNDRIENAVIERHVC